MQYNLLLFIFIIGHFSLFAQTLPDGPRMMPGQDSLQTRSRQKHAPTLPLSPHGTQSGTFVITVKDIAAFRQFLADQAIPGSILSTYPPTQSLTLRCADSVLYQQILPYDLVLYVEEAPAAWQEESLVLDVDFSLNRIHQVHHAFPQWRGQDMILSVKEQQYRLDDIDLQGRHLPTSLEAPFVSQHATDMATLIAGGGNASPRSQGVAWGAYLTSSDFSGLFPDLAADYQKYGITVQNHAYGTSVENFYGALAQAYDMSTYQQPHLLHVFSIGNSGNATDSAGTYASVKGYANPTGNFKTAKNILTVGAVNRQEVIDPGVSKGPAYDGRVKPELVAYSTAGSSNAAALVSGTALLVQQGYQQQHHDSLPEASLVKALLLNSAQDVGPSGIDFLSGYGNLDAYRALQTLANHRYRQGALRPEDSASFFLTVPAQARRLKITLVWHDPPATPQAARALVNDLDLTLMHPATGGHWQPWVLNPYPHPDSLRQLPQRSADRLNNIEQITVENPPAGTYQVRVAAYRLATADQAFSLAYQWDQADDFTWTYPTGSDQLPGQGDTTWLRWEATYGHTNGQLAYSLDGGVHWQPLAEAVPLQQGSYAWPVPDTFASCLVRMTVGDEHHITDAFTISRPPAPGVGFYCTDSLLLHWTAVENAQQYTLYGLGKKYLEPVATTTDTFAILRPEQYAGKYLALAAHATDGTTGTRSATLNYEWQGIDCYVASFLASEAGENVALTLQLGSTHQVKQVHFERQQQSQYVPLQTLPADQRWVVHHDSAARQGLNTYRARIEFLNGQEIHSELASVYWITQDPPLLFPNPVRLTETLNIYTKPFDQPPVYLELFDIHGKPVLKKQLLSERESLSVSPLTPGTYLYVLTAEGVRQSGKIIVQ